MTWRRHAGAQVSAAEVLRKVALEPVPGHSLDVIEPLTLGSATGFFVRVRSR
jgi:hypothetical protein